MNDSVDSAAEPDWEPYERELELLAPPPRPVRYTRPVRFWHRAAWNGAGLLLIGLAYVIENRNSLPWASFSVLFAVLAALLLGNTCYAIWLDCDSHDSRHLLANGIAVEGYIAERLHSPDSTVLPWSIRYGYVTRDGRGFEGTAAFPREFFESHPIGASLTVLYDPTNPSRNLPYVLMTKAEIAGAPSRN